MPCDASMMTGMFSIGITNNRGWIDLKSARRSSRHWLYSKGMHSTGFGVFYDYDDIPAGDRRLSADGSRVAERRHSEHRYDEETVYAIAVWDAATHEEVAAYTHMHSINRESGEVDGKPLKDLCWDETGRLLLVFSDDSTEPADPFADAEPPWERHRRQD